MQSLGFSMFWGNWDVASMDTADSLPQFEEIPSYEAARDWEDEWIDPGTHTVIFIQFLSLKLDVTSNPHI